VSKIRLGVLAREVIRPALEAEKIPWYGWHAFRHGLATNLHRLGVSDKVIQQILRPANVTTTINIYLKMVGYCPLSVPRAGDSGWPWRPTIRSQPHPGFSFAIRTTNRSVSSSTLGRPRDLRNFDPSNLLAMSFRYQSSARKLRKTKPFDGF
jgi:hypothetical protein